LALEKGFTPSTILPDIPTDFGFSELYIPQNFNNRFNGPIRFRVALASSLNVPAVYLLNQLGMETYLEKLRELHFESLENQTPGLGLALGNAEVSLLELVNAFSVFPKNGYYVPNNFLQNIDIETDVKSKATQVFSYDTSALICDILSDENSRALGFGYSEVFKPGFEAMFKTGTANQYQNITALGATPLFTVGVWMGNFDGETVLGKTGSSIPAAICKDLLMYLQGTENIKFTPPNQWEKVEICSLSGKIPTKYCKERVFEYNPISSSVEKEYCTWHTENGLVYPEIYRTWFGLKNRNGEILKEDGNLTILTPRNDSVFFYDPRALTKQKIKIEVVGGNTDSIFALLYNKDTQQFIDIQEITYPFDFYIPLNRGNFTLYLLTDSEKMENVLKNNLNPEQVLSTDEKIDFQVK
jgi:penicillin-binding protein 1C